MTYQFFWEYRANDLFFPIGEAEISQVAMEQFDIVTMIFAGYSLINDKRFYQILTSTFSENAIIIFELTFLVAVLINRTLSESVFS